MTSYEPRCKVCTSPNRKYYEEWYMTADPKPKWIDFENQAKVFGEDISFRAFERHFSRHFSPDLEEVARKEDEIKEVVEEKKKEVINLVEEIKNNLLGLKALLATTLATTQNRPPSPALLRSLTELYREHRQTLEACERLSSRLAESTGLTETEVLKFLYLFAKDLCPECLKKFRNSFDTYLKVKKGVESLSS